MLWSEKSHWTEEPIFGVCDLNKRVSSMTVKIDFSLLVCSSSSTARRLNMYSYRKVTLLAHA